MGDFLKIKELKGLSICDLGSLLVTNMDHVKECGAHIFLDNEWYNLWRSHGGDHA